MKLKKLGFINIAFAKVMDGICYYHMDVVIGDEKRHILLPRYHQHIGWIEIFGLPPQNEWVVLADLRSVEAEAELVVDDARYIEHFSYRPDTKKQTHEITITRSDDSTKETATWFEDYSLYPNVVKNNVTFTHANGEYISQIGKRPVTVDELEGEEREFVTRTIKNHGKPDQIWKKEFAGKGLLPPVYYSIFPVSSVIDLTELKGESIEIGYMHGGEDHIDRVHGDWYKRFSVNDKIFYINEDNYSSKTIDIDGQKKSIKNTYRKQLFVTEN